MLKCMGWDIPFFPNSNKNKTRHKKKLLRWTCMASLTVSNPAQPSPACPLRIRLFFLTSYKSLHYSILPAARMKRGTRILPPNNVSSCWVLGWALWVIKGGSEGILILVRWCISQVRSV